MLIQLDMHADLFLHGWAHHLTKNEFASMYGKHAQNCCNNAYMMLLQMAPLKANCCLICLADMLKKGHFTIKMEQKSMKE